MNSFAVLTAVCLMFCIGTAGILFRKQHIAEIVTLGTAWFFCSYICSAMMLFLLNVFTLERGIQNACLTEAIVFVTSALTSEKVQINKIKDGFSPEKELRVFVIPLLISLVGISFISQKNELFGMGQDEGVYQCEAINFIYGYDARQQDFEEYQILDSDEARENFQTAVHNKLVGYDIPAEDYPETVYNRNVSPVSGIYHGIPTYAAVLALWGKLFGIPHMADVQTVFYILTIFLICFVSDNLKLKPFSKLTAAVLTALSPVVIWVAKSSLTEMFLAVLMLLFLYFLTNPERPEYSGFSLLPIAVFSCYHVSVYTLMPYFMIVYAGMYFFTKKKSFAAMLLFSVLGYLLSYLMMCHVQPFYTMNNYRFVFNEHINVQNITETVLITSGVLILFCMIYILLVWKMKKTDTPELFLKDREHRVLMQWLIVCLTGFPLIFLLYKAFSQPELIHNISVLTISGFALNTGVLVLLAGIAAMFVRPEVFLENKEKIIIFISFFYCILIYSVFLRFQIDYYYYYARYLVPFIPAALLTAVTVLDKADRKIFITCSVFSLCAVLPYSAFLMNHKDDTRMEWNILEDITEQIPADACVVIETDSLPALWLPVRAVTGAYVFPSEKDISAQLRTLSGRYRTIYFLSASDYTYRLDSNLEIRYRNTVHLSEDTNFGEISSLPLTFCEETTEIYLYQYLNYQMIYNAEDISRFQLYGISRPEQEYCWTTSSAAAVRCMLRKEDYTMTLTLGSSLPLIEMKKERFPIWVSVNGISVGGEIFTVQNQPKEMKLHIPAHYLNDGTNVISFQTDTWSASVVNPKDTRMLGIPFQSLEFQKRR